MDSDLVKAVRAYIAECEQKIPDPSLLAIRFLAMKRLVKEAEEIKPRKWRLWPFS